MNLSERTRERGRERERERERERQEEETETGRTDEKNGREKKLKNLE